jgi:DNA N-6-adenine-methyltransferase Dam
MKHHQRTEGLNDEWLTPPEILKSLGGFDLDPCAPVVRPWPTARQHITLPQDGLSAEWKGRVWLNPPFNRYARPRWMRRMAEYGNGIMLIPAATETEAFDAYVWRKAAAVCFVKTRPHFHFADGKRAKANCGTAIALVAYGDANAAALEAANLGRTLKLNAPDQPRDERLLNTENGRAIALRCDDWFGWVGMTSVRSKGISVWGRITLPVICAWDLLNYNR